MLGDENALQHLFVNLILNSFQAIEGSGTIHIAVTYIETKDLLQVVYEDSGPGIPEERHSRIFDPFLRPSKLEKEPGSVFIWRPISLKSMMEK